MNTIINILLDFEDMPNLASPKRAFSIFGIFTSLMVFITIGVMVFILLKQVKAHKKLQDGGEEEIIDKISDNLQKFGESFSKGKDGTVTCQYCGGAYKISENKCPHCGASKAKK